MKKILTIFVLSIIFVIPAQANLKTGKLISGDILLQPLKCWSCSLIEDQEDSNFSHIGIVVNMDGKTMVAEAYGSVRLVTLEEFLKKTHPDKLVKARRLDYHFFDFEAFEHKLKASINSLIGNPYDRAFLWDNEINGKEAIYCSELVYKVILPQVQFWDLNPKAMPFDVNPELWDRYFRGDTPRGKLGVSPEDFNKSRDFITLWNIN
jgi:hypothetical protein